MSHIYTADEMPQGSEAWHAIRSRMLTASRMSEVITPSGKLSGSSDSLARELAAHYKAGSDPFEWTGNQHTDRGHEFEQEARVAFEEETGILITQVGFVEAPGGFLGCSPDGLHLGANGKIITGLEIKTANYRRLLDWRAKGEAPLEHLPQIHACMVVCGVTSWWFIAYNPRLAPYIFQVHANEYTLKLAAAAQQFHTKLLAEVERVPISHKLI